MITGYKRKKSATLMFKDLDINSGVFVKTLLLSVKIILMIKLTLEKS